MTPAQIARREDIHAQRAMLGRMGKRRSSIQRCLLWYLPQALCCMGLGALLTLAAIKAVLQCPHP